MTADLFDILLRANIIISIALIFVLLVRRPARGWLGARNAYLLWGLPLFSVLAALLPARQVTRQAPEPAFAPALQMAGEGEMSGPVLPLAADPLPLPGLIDMEMMALIIWTAGVLISLALIIWRQKTYVKSLGQLEQEIWDGTRIFRTETNGIGPALIGAVAPRLILPADFENLYTPQERELVITHERTHLRRGDTLANAIAILVRCLFWYNPLLHLAARLMRIDQELACDEAVLAQRPDARAAYARALLKTLLTPARMPVGCAWPAEGEHPLKERVSALGRMEQARKAQRAGTLLVTALSVTACAAAWGAQPPVVKLEAGNAAATSELATGERDPAPADASGSFIDRMAAAGLRNLTADQLIALKIHNVDPAMIQAVRDLGFDASPDDLVAMSIAGVTPAFVRSIREQGWKDVTIEELVSMRHMNVDPADANRFEQLGLRRPDIEELVRLKAMNVTPDYVRGLQAEGIRETNIDDWVHAKAMGVTAVFVADANRRGFSGLSLEKLSRLKAENIF